MGPPWRQAGVALLITFHLIQSTPVQNIRCRLGAITFHPSRSERPSVAGVDVCAFRLPDSQPGNVATFTTNIESNSHGISVHQAARREPHRQ